MSAGKELEGAVILAAKDYQRAGRADVFHRPTPKVFDRRRGENVFTSTAGVDFNGSVNGVAITFDAKETHAASLPLANIEEHQLDTLRRNRAGLSGLVIAFLPDWRCFWVGIAELDEFLAAKWRESLSQDWCKAFGLHLSVDCRPSLRKKGRFVRHVRFLDAVPHFEREEAAARVAKERAEAEARQKRNGEVMELFGETLHAAVHPYEEKPPFDPFAAKHLERFGRRNGVAKKNWSGK